MIPLSMGCQIRDGSSIMRGSDKNSFKYVRKAASVGAAGDPVFIKMTAVLSDIWKMILKKTDRRLAHKQNLLTA